MGAMKRTGAEELRVAAYQCGNWRESFNDRFTAEEILILWRMAVASGWDFSPDTWEERQVQEALRGKPPQWGLDNEKPVYGDATKITGPSGTKYDY